MQAGTYGLRAFEPARASDRSCQGAP